MPRKSHLDARAMTLLVACCAFWGFQQILIKLASRDMPPLWQALLRMAGATALLMPLFVLMFGVLLLDEPLSLRLLLALAGVAIGIVLVNRRTPAPR